MQIALLADIHGNLEALEAVLSDIANRSPQARLVCAGDVVGYGPEPEACLERLSSLGAEIVMGNHEEMVLGRRGFGQCVYAGIRAALWTRRHLSAPALTALERLPARVEPAPGVVVCHGDLEDAGTYVSTAPRAQAALSQLGRLSFGSRVLVCGHTHHALFYAKSQGMIHGAPGARLAVPAVEPCLVNPGAVGQSRDGRSLARYALLDLRRDRIEYVELPYDHTRTIEKLRSRRLVAKVDLQPPRGAARHLERLRTRWLRAWAVLLVARRTSHRG